MVPGTSWALAFVASFKSVMVLGLVVHSDRPHRGFALLVLGPDTDHGGCCSSHFLPTS